MIKYFVLGDTFFCIFLNLLQTYYYLLCYALSTKYAYIHTLHIERYITRTCRELLRHSQPLSEQNLYVFIRPLLLNTLDIDGVHHQLFIELNNASCNRKTVFTHYLLQVISISTVDYSTTWLLSFVKSNVEIIQTHMLRMTQKPRARSG